ncbi:hypothetical protein CKALI_11375 [Corynebacterium kalinowskii]|uniref:Uncharacterized protein n=1 Tax=Corynebacterium kalinowskii TaxID=2675216 RepID=A0A6B8VJ99_9CORY|nr:hypothetical protein [Corynebacterium kalinowskii]QGU03119.1 hypothetical protein CKALI_11375 [Corynebacterium kalinowskii]
MEQSVESAKREQIICDWRAIQRAFAIIAEEIAEAYRQVAEALRVVHDALEVTSRKPEPFWVERSRRHAFRSAEPADRLARVPGRHGARNREHRFRRRRVEAKNVRCRGPDRGRQQ